MERTSTIDFTHKLQKSVATMQGVGVNGYVLENDECVEDVTSLDEFLTQTIFKSKLSSERFQVTVIKLDDDEGSVHAE
jgi:hypothetical protein